MPSAGDHATSYSTVFEQRQAWMLNLKARQRKEPSVDDGQIFQSHYVCNN